MTALLFIAALFQPASQPTSQPASQPTAKPAPFKMGDKAMVHTGAKFTVEKATSLDEIAANPAKFKDQTLKVTGTIKTVCQKKGCWATLAGAEPTSRARVTFKDYGFFAPMDSTGLQATVEGTVAVKMLGEAERKHLADDAKASIDTIPQAELRIVANGIEVRRAAK